MEETKYKYALFAYPQYYPSGGYNDFVGRFATIDQAFKHLHTKECANYEYAHVVLSDVIIASYRKGQEYEPDDMKANIVGKWIEDSIDYNCNEKE